MSQIDKSQLFDERFDTNVQRVNERMNRRLALESSPIPANKLNSTDQLSGPCSSCNGAEFNHRLIQKWSSIRESLALPNFNIPPHISDYGMTHVKICCCKKKFNCVKLNQRYKNINLYHDTTLCNHVRNCYRIPSKENKHKQTQTSFEIGFVEPLPEKIGDSLSGINQLSTKEIIRLLVQQCAEDVILYIKSFWNRIVELPTYFRWTVATVALLKIMRLLVNLGDDREVKRTFKDIMNELLDLLLSSLKSIFEEDEPQSFWERICSIF